ncbi:MULTISPECIES: hypothetical protein, partial [unclassified Pseudomonas]|uniref:hypothetical protein n=1 Tax=unclassified Pseudomonas TaxID=196821 RepID=UPI00249B0359
RRLRSFDLASKNQDQDQDQDQDQKIAAFGSSYGQCENNNKKEGQPCFNPVTCSPASDCP